VAEPFSKWGDTSSRQKNYRQLLWFELATVTSQAWKYGVITCTSHEGLNYIILDKITPLSKRIGEPPEIQIGCYRDDPGQQRHSGSSCSFFWLNKTVRGLSHWNFHLLSFCLAISLLCDVSYVTINENSHDNFSIVDQRTSQSSDNASKSSAYRTRLIHISPNCWTIYRLFEIITVRWTGLQSNVLYSKNIQSDINYVLKNTKLHRAARALMDK